MTGALRAVTERTPLRRDADDRARRAATVRVESTLQPVIFDRVTFVGGYGERRSDDGFALATVLDAAIRVVETGWHLGRAAKARWTRRAARDTERPVIQLLSESSTGTSSGRSVAPARVTAKT